MSEKRLLCFGEMLVRLSAPNGESLLQTPQMGAHIGGAEANVAICVSRLGAPAAMATVLPDNPLGHACRDELRRHGVDVEHVAFAPGRMGLYLLTPGAVIRPAEILYDRAGSAFSEAPHSTIDWKAALTGAGFLHISGITPAVSARAGEGALAAAAAAKTLGVPVSFDGNYRTRLWQARGENGREILRTLLSRTQLAFVDERDVALVLEKNFSTRDEAAAAAFAAFPQLQRIVATVRKTHAVDAFSLGATMHTRAGVVKAEALELANVVDRIGGGDAFAGGLLFGLMQGWADAEALDFALHTAAAKHGQMGDASHASEAAIRAMMGGGVRDIRR